MPYSQHILSTNYQSTFVEHDVVAYLQDLQTQIPYAILIYLMHGTGHQTIK